jgi:hypothetical protein
MRKFIALVLLFSGCVGDPTYHYWKVDEQKCVRECVKDLFEQGAAASATLGSAVAIKNGANNHSEILRHCEYLFEETECCESDHWLYPTPVECSKFRSAEFIRR